MGSWRRTWGPVLGLASGFALSCQPKIGDECTSSIDCPQLGAPLCLTTEPGGYCTQFNCEADNCPGDEAACVAFDTVLDPACSEENPTTWARFERTFCLATCEEPGDCRSEYECVDPGTRQGLIIDREPVANKVCMVKANLATAPVGEEPAICSGGDAEQPNYTPWEHASDGGGGSGGEIGAGGEGALEGGSSVGGASG